MFAEYLYSPTIAGSSEVRMWGIDCQLKLRLEAQPRTDSVEEQDCKLVELWAFKSSVGCRHAVGVTYE